MIHLLCEPSVVLRLLVSNSLMSLAVKVLTVVPLLSVSVYFLSIEFVMLGFIDIYAATGTKAPGGMDTSMLRAPKFESFVAVA